MAWKPTPTPPKAQTIDQFESVLANVSEAAHRAARDPKEVTLVAVTKTFSSDAIWPVLEAGHRTFGENRVQEAASKWPSLKSEFPQTKLHLIGPLQSNKADDAVALFDVIETVDRPKIAKELKKAEKKYALKRRYLVQVNTGEEAQKSGIAPREAVEFYRYCREDIGLAVEGFMCIPPLDQVAAPHFALLRKLADQAGCSILSMGMSADYAIAIQQGATHVRLGSAIFGGRA